MQVEKFDLYGNWREAMPSIAGPRYLRIVELLRRAIHSGALVEGDPLPSHRELGKQLEVNFTTVTRAYDEAKRQRLVEGRPGQGTFVSGGRDIVSALPRIAAAPTLRPDEGVIDLTSTWPPNRGIAATLLACMHTVVASSCLDFVTRRGGAVSRLDLDAAASWIAHRNPALGGSLSERVAIASGSRNALIALLTIEVGSGGALLVEELVWPTIRALADVLSIKLIPVSIDSEGMRPDALEDAARQSSAKVLYCVPTMQNPTGAVMSIRRREDIVAVARRTGLTIIEDDAYSALLEDAPPSMATLAPEISYCVLGFAKLISPGMRVAYVLAPDARKAARLTDVLRITMQTAAPIELALATQLVMDRQMSTLIDIVRSEARGRQAIVARILAEYAVCVPGDGLFAWLDLPAHWVRAEFVNALRDGNVLVVPSDVFVVEGASAPNAVRIATGGVESQEALEVGVTAIHALLARNAQLSSLID